MIISKHFKIIALKWSDGKIQYFKGFDEIDKSLLYYSDDIEEALNLHQQDDEDIEYYKELISNKLWQLAFTSPEIVFIEFASHVTYTETTYNNPDHTKMNAIKKLNQQEIEALGLEDLSLYYTMKTGLNLPVESSQDPQFGLRSNIKPITFDLNKPIDQMLLSLKGDMDVI